MRVVPIMWRGVSLNKVSCEKDLGVWIYADMKCSKQCMYAFNKSTRVLGMIKRTIRFRIQLLGLMLNTVLVLGIPTIEKTRSYLRKSRGCLLK